MANVRSIIEKANIDYLVLDKGVYNHYIAHGCRILQDLLDQVLENYSTMGRGYYRTSDVGVHTIVTYTYNKCWIRHANSQVRRLSYLALAYPNQSPNDLVRRGRFMGERFGQVMQFIRYRLLLWLALLVTPNSALGGCTAMEDVVCISNALHAALNLHPNKKPSDVEISTGRRERGTGSSLPKTRRFPYTWRAPLDLAGTKTTEMILVLVKPKPSHLLLLGAVGIISIWGFIGYWGGMFDNFDAIVASSKVRVHRGFGRRAAIRFKRYIRTTGMPSLLHERALMWRLLISIKNTIIVHVRFYSRRAIHNKSSSDSRNQLLPISNILEAEIEYISKKPSRYGKTERRRAIMISVLIIKLFRPFFISTFWNKIRTFPSIHCLKYIDF
ncbi:uncharacterized protein MCYG_08159 [Microsporum canis CBS 113480]|uniref:Uncharacterized protein n=1 Tax=Arthroderma otae (strain ATCC MYA-4605 / CBS 113480) TaxID=554155 RepID=C5FZN7_ARTOC|nr:uncharacterized protein MCYG_08159 [Microsporum canis CBS 113480]EEQ35340.1 hypothetical protein MCYG_08159 [Microsporum canis CBS 113480]